VTEPVKNFVCWYQSAVTSVSAVDVHSLSDWLFNAVHHPLRPQRRELRAEGPSRELQWVVEDNVVEALKQDVGPDGYLLIPIFGNAGTGKTHLVKWVHTQCADQADWHQIYMKKNHTSLRNVIENLIDGLKGPIKAQTLEKLESAPAQNQSPAALGNLLIDRIAHEVGFGGSRDSEIPDKERGLIEMVRRDLPSYLQDKDVKPLLTGEDGVIPRLVHLSSGNRQPDDDYDPDEEREFRLDDLALIKASEKVQHPSTKNTIRKWLGPGQYRQTAVALVNEVLPSAIRQIFIASVNLSELLEDLRMELHKQGKELVIFIEDLTVFRGVEEELLDALTVPATPDADEPMCKLRAIFAVTEGYLDARRGFKARCRDAFSLDAQPGSEGLGEEDVTSLVGRYLNVTRMETEETGRRTRRPVRTPENACGGCKERGGPGQEVCHAVFGKSEEGYGLYPFNRTSLNHLVNHRLNDGAFDPRETVRGLCDFLNEGIAQIPSAEFPSDMIPELLGDGAEPLPIEVRTTIGRLWPPEHERVEALVRYWSRNAPLIDDGKLGLSDPGVLTAFGIDPEDIRVIEPEPPGPDKPDPTPEKEEQWHDRLGSPHKELATKLDQWAAGTDLTAGQTMALRDLIRRAITDNLQYGPTPLNHKSPELQNRFHLEHDIGVNGSVTQMPTNPVITIEADTDTAMAIQGLIRLRFLPDDRSFAAHAAQILAANKLEEWTDRVSAHLYESAPPEVEEPIQALVMAALLNGNCENCETPSDYAQAIFHGDLEPGKVEGRTKKWAGLVPKLAKESTTERTRLDTIRQMLGETQGSGARFVNVVDASRLVPVVRSFIAEPELESAHPKIQQLARQFKEAVEAEWKDLRKGENAIDLLHHDDPLKIQVEKIIDALEAAAAAGLIEGGDISILEDVREFNETLDDDTHPHHAIFGLAALDDADLTLLDKAQWAASPKATDVRTISELAGRIDEQFKSINRTLGDGDGDGVGDGGGDGVGDGGGDGKPPAISGVVVSVMKELTALEQSLEKLRP